MSDEKILAQAEMLGNRLRKKYKHLAKWAKRTGAGAFRLYDRDIPEIPLVLDFYGESPADGAIAGALYERPYEKDEDDERRWLETMREAAAAALGIGTDTVFIGLRRRQKGTAQYEKKAGGGVTRYVSEGGLRFKVNLSDYLDTGLFPDRRLMRALVRQDAGPQADGLGKKVLNLFCYTGSFSVYAAAGGAAETCSVDLSNTYLDRAKENFGLNRFKADFTSPRDFFASARRGGHRLVRCDALLFLRQARAAGYTWDSIILDPPAFSNSKKMSATLDLKRDHPHLIAGSLDLLARGGKLWFSANARSFNADAAGLQTILTPRFPAVQVTDISGKTTDEDFRGRKTPKSFLIEIADGA